MDKNEQVKKVVMEILNNQIKDNNPPITKKTLERLMHEGYSEGEAKDLMSEIVWAEIFVVLKGGQTFNLDRYTAAMEYLPQLPWDDNN